jgi:hypothetical protein
MPTQSVIKATNVAAVWITVEFIFKRTVSIYFQTKVWRLANKSGKRCRSWRQLAIPYL